MKKSNARIQYERQTKALIESFQARQISSDECIGELDAAFERFLLTSKDELSAVRALVLGNNNAVMEEIAMRPIHLVPKKQSDALAVRQV